MTRLYGEDTYHQIRRLESLRKKKAHLLCALTFLLRCRDNGITPRFLKQKRHFSTPATNRIYSRLEKALLRERIHQTRRELAFNDHDLLLTHLELSNRLQKKDWDLVDHITHASHLSTMGLATARQKQKYNNISRTKQPPPSLDTQRTVVNLSNRQLTTTETSVLAKGGNFAITPARIPTEDIIANIEASIRTLPRDTAEEIRRESSRILQHAKPPKSNLSYIERSALKTLNADKDILVLSADKGNATVVLNTKDYHKKIQDLLNPDTYRRLHGDPTKRILRKTNLLIKKSSIPIEEQRQLRKSEALSPRLYGLPKIHKPDIPLRPIVNAIGSPTYAIAKYLTGLLKPFVGNTASFIRDSSHFIEKIKPIKLQPGDLLVSFDVTSLFTMVPLKETLSQLQQLFPDDITALFHHVLTTTYFQWNNNFYEQIDGVAMGSPLSPIIANLYMETFEKAALDSAPLKPLCWYRYVDDVFSIWSHGEAALNDFLLHLNSVHPRIQFTLEKEKDGKLAFLDVLISKKVDGRLGHTVFRKPTHTDRYLNKNSNHHPSQKHAVLKTLIHRASRICEPSHLQQELHHLNQTLQANGYSQQEIRHALRPRRSPRPTPEPHTYAGTAFLPYIKSVTDRIGKILKKHNVSTVYKPTQQIRHMLRSAKDKRDPLSTPGVYRIPCSCGEVYIGTTQRSVDTRLNEHKRHCRLVQPEKSAVAEHALQEGNHTIHFDRTEVLSKVSQYYTRLNREAIEIYKHRNNFNRKEEGVNLHHSWYPALQNTLRYTHGWKHPQQRLGSGGDSALIQAGVGHTDTAQPPSQDLQNNANLQDCPTPLASPPGQTEFEKQKTHPYAKHKPHTSTPAEGEKTRKTRHLNR